MIYLAIGMVIVVLCKIAEALYKRKQRGELLAAILAIKRINGEDDDIAAVCEKLLTEEEYLMQLMSGGLSVNFGAGGMMTVAEMPEVQVLGDDMAILTLGKRKIEFMRLQVGNKDMVRLTEIGAHGASRTVLECGKWELLRALTGIKIVREEYDI